MTDMEKARRETLRWRILQCLDVARPLGTSESVILAALADDAPGLTRMELRRELAYLEDRKLLTIDSKSRPIWHGALTRYGVDVVEHTVECEPGIARPPKYW